MTTYRYLSPTRLRLVWTLFSTYLPHLNPLEGMHLQVASRVNLKYPFYTRSRYVYGGIFISVSYINILVPGQWMCVIISAGQREYLFKAERKQRGGGSLQQDRPQVLLTCRWFLLRYYKRGGRENDPQGKTNYLHCQRYCWINRQEIGMSLLVTVTQIFVFTYVNEHGARPGAASPPAVVTLVKW